MMPKHSLRSSCLAAAAVAVVTLVSAAPAQAAPPQSGGGEGTIERIDELSSRTAGTNVIVERTLGGTFTGTLSGTVLERVRGVVRPDGTVTFHGTLVFTGTVDGCGTGTGTEILTARLEGRGQTTGGLLGGPLTEANVQIVDQAANTVGVTGHGSVQQNGPLLSYSIRYSCH